MATRDITTDDRRMEASRPSVTQREETKASFLTTEFWAMVGVIVGILVASAMIGEGEGTGAGAADAFSAVRAWLYVAIVVSAYMISRGLAKAGSREPYWADQDDLPGRYDR